MSEWIHDAHAHLGTLEEQEIRKSRNIYTLLNAASPKEYERIRVLHHEAGHIIPTFGIHPWQADQWQIEEVRGYLEETPIIGEIGMDNVWCEVPLEKQKEIFIQQMDYAEKHLKPVILHTKGQEKEIGEIIACYTMPILVHWYADTLHLETYCKRDCFFTIGPDFRESLITLEIARRVPLNRLLVESDGVGAISWAVGKTVLIEELPQSLKEAMEWVAKVKGVAFEVVSKQMQNNWEHFVTGKRLS